MASSIDPTKPVTGNPTTQSVRDNFAFAKNEIESLQDDVTDGASNLATHQADTTTHGTTGDIVGTSDTQTLTNKTIDADLNTVSNLAHGAEVDSPSSGVHGVTGSVVGTTDTQTLTNKSVDLTVNTLTGTTAEFNAALSDGDFATLAGAETLANKTLTSPTINTPTLDLSGVTSAGDLPVADGGTGASTAAAARTNLDAQEDVITTRGDVIRGSSGAAAERLALGSAGQALVSDGTDVAWAGQRSIITVGTLPTSTVSAGSTVFLGPTGATSAGETQTLIAPRDGTIKNLFVLAAGNPGAGETFTYTSHVNGVDQALTAQISGDAQRSNSDTANSVSVSQGDRIEVKLVTSASATARVHSATFEFEG